MYSLRTHIVICGSLFAAMLFIGWGGNILQATGVIRDAGAFQIPILVLMLGLVVAFAFSAIPVMVMLVLGFQRRIGNQDVPVVASVLKAEKTIIWAIWGLMAAGLVIAVPAAIYSGAFSTGSYSGPAAPGPSEGTLVARPGMLFSDMVRQSTIHIDVGKQQTWTGSVIGDQVFDFQVAGTAIRFPNCRYWFAAPFVKDVSRIESLNVGTSPSTISRAELDAANADLRRKLAADGWLTGHEVYRDEEDQMLHGGATRGPEGTVWLKNGIVLDIAERRIDDEVPGEDAKTAGKWIQYVDLWERDDYAGIERYEFAPPQEGRAP